MNTHAATANSFDEAAASEARLFARFAELGLEVAMHRHPPLHTVAESQALRGSIAGGHCKNLFLKDRKGAFWLVVTLEEQVVDLKRLHERIGSGRLSFGNADALMEMLGVLPGAVTPFALINDVGRRVRVVLDAAMLDEAVLNYHPLRNDATCSISRDGLLRFVESCGHEPLVLDLSGGGE